MTPGGECGLDGSHGAHAWTRTAAPVTMPPVGSTVTVNVADTRWIAVGQFVWLANAGDTGAGCLQVTAVSGNTVTLLNPVVPEEQPFVDNSKVLLTEKSPSFPQGIVIPAHQDDPDAVWEYGPYDDHFDGIALNPKWSQVGSAGNISVSGSRVHLFAYGGGATGATYIHQLLPSAQSFTASFKFEPFSFVAPQAGTSAGSYFCISNPPNGYFQLDSTVWYNAAFQPMNNTGVFSWSQGANLGSVGRSTWIGRFPQYWRVQFNYTTRAVDSFYSFDGVGWMRGYSATGATSGFTTNPPTRFDFGVSTAINANSYLVSDWFRLTIP